MKHSYIAEGFGVRLRPVRLEDAAFIVWLRHLDRALGKIGDSGADVASQERWLDTYFHRESDCYFIIETLGENPVGTFGVYDVSDACAECGRFVVRPGVQAAIPSSLLAGDMIFGQMGVRQLRATAVAANHTILSINRKLGFHEVRLEPGGRNIAGHSVDMVHLVGTPEDWSRCRERIVALARRAERQIIHWDQAQSGRQEWREAVLETVK